MCVACCVCTVCVCACVCVCVCVCVYMCVHACIHVCVYMCVYMCVCTCVRCVFYTVKGAKVVAIRAFVSVQTAVYLTGYSDCLTGVSDRLQ